jgi:hydroxymethylpyrimidine/phosphomethylpyrimidine kinase
LRKNIHKNPKRLPAVLSFASLDPSCGAGLQADCLTVAALGCQPLAVACGLTVQDSCGVLRLAPAEPALVEEQAEALLADMPVSAFKAGALGSAQNAAIAARIAARHPEIPLVVDPVLASGRGDPLADEALILALNEQLLPRATVATPNTQEASRLDLRAAKHLVLTGGHEPGEQISNHLYAEGKLLAVQRWPRIPGQFHGTGCAFASALAAGLALGEPVERAAWLAGHFVWQAALHAHRPGRGQLFLQHFAAPAPGFPLPNPD